MRQVILSEKEIKKICKDLGAKFTEMFKNDKKAPVFIGVLNGACPFFMEIIKNVKCMMEIDFVQYSSYGGGTTSGTLVMKKEITADIRDRNVVVIEDIIDSGKTLKMFKEHLNHFQPKNVYLCALLDKKVRRQVDCEVDFSGKVIDDYFVCGFGLDYKEFFRNGKDVFVPTPKQIKEADKKYIER